MKGGMPWFKMYTEARTDAKLRTLTDAEHRVWFSLLCFASDQDTRGTISDYDEELLAIEVCNADGALLRVTLEKLTRLRIISMQQNTITFCAFARRQHVKPSDTPERVKSRVAKHRARTNTDDVTPRNTHVTPRNALKRLDIDKEEDKDTEESSVVSGKVVVIERVETAIREPLTRTRTPSQKPKITAQTAPSAEPIPLKPKPQNPLWDVLVEVFYEPMTGVEKSNFGKIVHQLKEGGAYPEDVRFRVRQHAKAQNHWDLTPNALVTHWSELAGKNGKASSNNGTTQQEFYDPAKDEKLLERKRAGARLVQELSEQQTPQRLPRQM